MVSLIYQKPYARGLCLGIRQSFSVTLGSFAVDQESGQQLFVTAEIGLLAMSCCVPESQGEVDSSSSSRSTSLKRHFLLFFCLDKGGLH